MNSSLRDQIRATEPRELESPDLDRIRRRGRRRRVATRSAAVLGAAAVAAVAVVGLGELTASPVRIDPARPGPGDPAVTETEAPGTTTPSSRPSDATSPAASPDTSCGVDLPVTVPVPDGYDERTTAPSPDRTDELEAGQLAVHWTGATGTIEVRWPADGDAAVWDDSSSLLIGRDIRREDGTWIQTIGLPATGVTESGCTHMQVTVYDQSVEGLDAAIEELIASPYPPVGTPLVADSREADALPSAIGCNAPPDTSPPPNQGGEPETTSAVSPEEALAAFLEVRPTLLPAEYTPLLLPDGSIAYVQPAPDHMQLPADAHEAYITVIHVTETAVGWQVDSWDASGC